MSMKKDAWFIICNYDLFEIIVVYNIIDFNS